jgi:hypothetical protein
MAVKMSEAARRIRNQYQKAWYARHTDKRAQYQRDFWERKAAAEQAKESKGA